MTNSPSSALVEVLVFCLRLDVPRASDDERESDGETRLIPLPATEELTAVAKAPDA